MVSITRILAEIADLAYKVLDEGFKDVKDYYLSDGGVVTVNSETAESVGIDPDTFSEFGQITTVTTGKE